jgi:hypothetical protein
MKLRISTFKNNGKWRWNFIHYLRTKLYTDKTVLATKKLHPVCGPIWPYEFLMLLITLVRVVITLVRVVIILLTVNITPFRSIQTLFFAFNSQKMYRFLFETKKNVILLLHFVYYRACQPIIVCTYLPPVHGHIFTTT